MKTLLTVLILAGLFGCKEDSKSFTGRLNVAFTNSSKLTVGSKVYELNNLDYPLFQDLHVDATGNLTIELNYGNHIIEYFKHDDLSGGHFAQRKAFQITPGKTTSLTIDL